MPHWMRRWKSGTITEEEYENKKNILDLNAEAPQTDTAKLKALDEAFESGVLTRDEYERKKREFGAEIPPPAPASASPAAPDPIPDPAPRLVKPTEIVVAGSEPQPEPLPKSWSTHNDPAGFAVNLPPAWTVGNKLLSGQIILRGARGEEVMIWPLQLEQPELDARGAAAVVQALALKFDVLMPWGAAQTTGNVTRVVGLGAQRDAMAMLSWANNPSGASVYFYVVETPGEIYGESINSIAAILRSFHITPDPAAINISDSAGGSQAVEPNFVNWEDPHNAAASVSVPQGWQVIGGTYRVSTLDIRYAVAIGSPDGQVRASIGDSNVGAFAQPTATLAAAGLHEGDYQTLGDGSRVEVLDYLSGQKFARSYVETLVSRQCGNLQIGSNNTREDLASAYSQSAASEGFTDALLTAGEVSFSCTLDGRAAKGKYIAATIRMAPGTPALWIVYRLYGYIAFAGREQEGEKVLSQILRSWNFHPDWKALGWMPEARPRRRTTNIPRRAANAPCKTLLRISGRLPKCLPLQNWRARKFTIKSIASGKNRFSKSLPSPTRRTERNIKSALLPISIR